MQRASPNLRLFSRRLFTTSTSHSTAWSPGPSPPRLPKEEQEIFEQLQRESTGAFSTPRQPPKINQSPQYSEATPDSQPQMRKTLQINQSPNSSSQEVKEELDARVRTGDGEELHPNIRRGAAPEFEGDRNPLTGEVGGPKNNPLRWGSTEQAGDWSYNGRVTDF